MSGHLAGITVDAVREQLAALGHDDVSDDVIASFLTSLDHQVGNGHNFASTSSSGSMMNSDGGAVGGADTAVHDTAVHARGHGDAPSSPSHKRNNASLRRYSSKYLAARTPGGSEIISPAETRVSADDEDPGAMTPSPSSAASKRAARATPNGTRVRPASSGHRTAVLAIPTKCSPTTEPKSSSSSKTHPKMKTPSSATTRHRRTHAPNADTHEDIIGWCAKRSVQPVTPHTTRTSSSSSAATPGSSDKTKTKNKTSVIKSSMPVRPGTFAPGQRVRIDRVARAAQYNAVWSGDAYLERRGGDGTNSNKFPVFAGGKVNSTSRLDFDNFENADEATVFGTKPRVEDIDVCGVNSAVYDVNGPRGGSWGRAQRKLTDGVNENRLEKGKTSSGFWQKRDDARAPMAGGFKTPGENRRDALRWEVRARMAAPPTF